MSYDRIAWPGRTFKYIYDGSQIAAYYNEGYTRLIWGQGVDTLLARQRSGGNLANHGTQFYLTDRQGSVLGMILAQDKEKSDDSVVTAGSWTKVITYKGAGADRVWALDFGSSQYQHGVVYDEFEYAGRLFDFTTHLQNNRARWFHPGTGQFTSKDSMRYSAGDVNLYRYAGNDWVNATDPSGHFLLASALATMAGGAIVGGAVGYYYGGWEGAQGLAGAGAIIGLGAFATAIGQHELGAGLIGFGIGYGWGGMTGRGNFDFERAVAAGLSGGMTGLGLALSYGRASAFGGDVLGSGLIGAGVSGLASLGLSSDKPVDWRLWAGDSLVGGITGVGEQVGQRLGGFGGSATGAMMANHYAQNLAIDMGLRDKFDYTELALNSIPLGLPILGAGARWIKGSRLGKVAERVARPYLETAGVFAGKGLSKLGSGVDNLGTFIGKGFKPLEPKIRDFVHGTVQNSPHFNRLHDPLTKVAHWLKLKACFAAGTPIRTPDGHQRIEDIVVGDLVLSRDETNPDGLVIAQTVEEIFVREGFVWNLRIAGREIETTGEHPFFVQDKGWTNCQDLVVGDLLMTEDGTWLAVEHVAPTDDLRTLYNFRVSDYHTYFVGTQTWGFAVWAHNANYGNITRGKTILDNAADGADRATRVHTKLAGRFKNASVQSERYLRTADGKRAIDPVTGEARRIDHAVIENGQVRYLVETTSKTANKGPQLAKEARIRANGGTFIRDKQTRQLIDVSTVPTRLMRRK